MVVSCAKLPHAGETIKAARVDWIAGGKGANQALACARLGAEVTFIGAVGSDDNARIALANLDGIDLRLQTFKQPTGIAVILVDDSGENIITVLPGANDELSSFAVPQADAVLCQLEIPDCAVHAAYEAASGLFCLNASPIRLVQSIKPDLTIVNQHEYEALDHRDGLVAVTYGERGASLFDGGAEVARASAPKVTAVDGTAAGDAFAGCLLVSLLEGRPHEQALRRACAAGAVAASRFGAQTSLPNASDVDAMVATSGAGSAG
jgi:ribokinase